MHCCAADYAVAGSMSAPHLDQNAIQSHNTTAIELDGAQHAVNELEALTFDVFGTLIDWETDGERP